MESTDELIAKIAESLGSEHREKFEEMVEGVECKEEMICALENTIQFDYETVEKSVALKVIQGEALGLSLIEQTELLTRVNPETENQDTLEKIRTEGLARFISVDVVFQNAINLFN